VIFKEGKKMEKTACDICGREIKFPNYHSSLKMGRYDKVDICHYCERDITRFLYVMELVKRKDPDVEYQYCNEEWIKEERR
jgi:hypothetical protein